MVNNLRDFGSKTSAKCTTIDKQIINAMSNFNKIRDKNSISHNLDESEYNNGIQNGSEAENYSLADSNNPLLNFNNK